MTLFAFTAPNVETRQAEVTESRLSPGSQLVGGGSRIVMMVFPYDHLM